MDAAETAITFPCGDAVLVGILHRPARAARRGVVIVVGGPQYRVGSHRQFLLLARDLAAAGHAVLRFDCRGMGDSDGAFAGFGAIDADIGAAVDALCARVPEVTEVILWGLCDGASAIAFYAPGDARIGGIALVNPWVRTEAGAARTQLRHYYLKQLFSRAFWSKLLTGKLRLGRALTDLRSTVHDAKTGEAAEPASLPTRVAAGLRAYRGRVLLVLSGDDLTAREFETTVLQTPEMTAWAAGPEITLHRLPDANHTFSRAEWRTQVQGWLRALSDRSHG